MIKLIMWSSGYFRQIIQIWVLGSRETCVNCLLNLGFRWWFPLLSIDPLCLYSYPWSGLLFVKGTKTKIIPQCLTQKEHNFFKSFHHYWLLMFSNNVSCCRKNGSLVQLNEVLYVYPGFVNGYSFNVWVLLVNPVFVVSLPPPPNHVICFRSPFCSCFKDNQEFAKCNEQNSGRWDIWNPWRMSLGKQ